MEGLSMGIDAVKWAIVGLCAYAAIGWVMAEWLFTGYVFAAHVDKAKRINDNHLPPLVWLLSARSGATFLVVDVVFNLLYGTFILWSIPRLFGQTMDWTFSQHMCRYWQAEPDNFRSRRIKWLVEQSLINLFDHTGQHIYTREAS